VPFQAYGDESGFHTQRYQSVAVVSGAGDDVRPLRDELAQHLSSNQLTELKFAAIKGDSRRTACARAFLQTAVDFASMGRLRVDVLTWDIKDSRHRIQGRDDIACLERMYYHVLEKAARRWGQLEWEFHPDHRSGVDFDEIGRYLSLTSAHRQSRRRPRLLSLFHETRKTFEFSLVRPVMSHQEPLVQLADVFAGLACFSIREGTECLRWLAQRSEENAPLPLDGLDSATATVSRSSLPRYELIAQLRQLGRRHRLGISFAEKRRLWTPRPTRPISFWHYEPQSELDRAPLRRSRGAVTEPDRDSGRRP